MAERINWETGQLESYDPLEEFREVFANIAKKSKGTPTSVPPEETPKKVGKKYYVGKKEVSKSGYLAARSKLGFGRVTGQPPLLEAPAGITPRVGEAIAEGFPTPKEKEETRREAFREETGSGELAEELQKKIEAPPSMQPEPILGITPEQFAEGRIFQPFGISATGASARLLENPEAELKRAGVELAAGTAIGGLSLGFLSSLVAKAGITKAVMGNISLLKGATAGLALYLGVGAVFDYRGKEMDVFRGRVQKVIEDGERIEASARNGFPTTDTIALLSTIVEEVDEAEKRITELGIYNLEYKVSKEYLLDQSRVKSARIALIRRIEAVENIAATGTGALRPEELLFEVEQMGRGGGGE